MLNKFKVKPGFVYIRPFTVCFLNTISAKYNIAIYSEYSKEFLSTIIGELQNEKELFCVCVTNMPKEGPKLLTKFIDNTEFNELTSKNTMIIDQDPCVVAHNTGMCVPVNKFEGNSKDSTLLFLEKYLLDLAESEDICEEIKNDFYVDLLNHNN